MSYFNKISQNVVADPNNSTTGNLIAGAIYTGVASSTLGIVGIQVSLKTSQDCTVYVDQSPDGTNWDIVDDYKYYTHDGGNGWTVQALNSYCRVRASNDGPSTTSYFRLQTALCPMVEAVPRTLDNRGNLNVGVKGIEDFYGFISENTPMGEIRVAEPFRLVGTTFVGNVPDTNFWTGTSGNGGSYSQTGCQILLSTNTTTGNGYATYQTVRYGRYVGASCNRFRAIVQLGDAGEADNSRKWGAFDSSNGCYFELDGTTLYATVLKAGSPTRVASANWNNNTTVPTLTNVNTYEIYWTNSRVHFSIGDVLRHVYSASSTPWSDTLTLPVRLSTTNSNNLATDKTLTCRVATISRLGKDRTESIYKHITAGATTICKYGPGTLHKVIVSSPSNQNITIYDNISVVAASVIGIIAPGNNTVPFQLDYNCPFFIGLTIVTAGSIDVTIIYE